MFCKNCGTQFKDGINVCPACGTVNEFPEVDDKTIALTPEQKNIIIGTTAPEMNSAPHQVNPYPQLNSEQNANPYPPQSGYNPYPPTAPVSAAVNPKSNNTKKVTLIIIVCVLAVALIALIIGIVLKGVKESKPTAGTGAVSATYTQLHDDLVEQLGEFNPETASENPLGLYALYSLNKPKAPESSGNESEAETEGEQFVAVYTEKNNGKIESKIAYYKQKAPKDNSSNTDSEAASAELVGSVTLNSIEDYTASSESFQLPEESMLYSFEYEDNQYLAYEHLTYFEGRSYDVQIFTVDDEGLHEESNLSYPNISSVGTEIVYSDNLPDSMNVDDSDLDLSSAESGSYIEENYHSNGETILYYVEGADSDYVYDSNYSSCDEAVHAYLDAYGLDRDEYVTYNDTDHTGRYFSISAPENVNFIYTYVHYLDSQNNGAPVYLFNNFPPENTAEVTSEPASEEVIPDLTEADIKKLVKEAGEVSEAIVDEANYDENDTIEVQGEYGETQYFRFNYRNVKTWQDWINLNLNYFSKESVETEYGGYAHKYGENGLYLPIGGVGCEISRIDYTLNKINDKEYILKSQETYEYSEESSAYCSYYQLNYVNGKWIFNDVLPFYTAYFADSEYSSFTIGEPAGKNAEAIFAYQKTLNEVYDEYYDGDTSVTTTTPEYFLYDMDGDGVSELITYSVKSMAECNIQIFTYENGKSVKIYQQTDTRASVHIPNDGKGLMVSYYYAPGEYANVTIDLLTKNANEVVSENIINDNEVVFEERDGIVEQYFGKGEIPEWNDNYNYTGLNKLLE